MKNQQGNTIQDELDNQPCEALESSIGGIELICKDNPHWEPSKIIDQWQEENKETLENARNDNVACDLLVYELMEDIIYFADSEDRSVEQATLIIESMKLLVSKLLANRSAD